MEAVGLTGRQPRQFGRFGKRRDRIRTTRCGFGWEERQWCRVRPL